MRWLKCKHSLGSLSVLKQHTVEPVPEDPQMEKITYHFLCGSCGENVSISHGRITVPIRDWLLRKT